MLQHKGLTPPNPLDESSLCEAIRTTVDSFFLFESPCFIVFNYTSLAQFFSNSNSPTPPHPRYEVATKHALVFRVDPSFPQWFSQTLIETNGNPQPERKKNGNETNIILEYSMSRSWDPAIPASSTFRVLFLLGNDSPRRIQACMNTEYVHVYLYGIRM